MTVVPMPTIVTVPPDVTVATLVTLLVYVNAPLLLLVGAMLNDASPTTLLYLGITTMVGTAGETTNEADTDFNL
jgi:predicted metal-binding membrane protein